ncbi:DUF86 domain-containing protein [Patescibacteria group bacterium]|nr:DUF86 domain-containing protein [Patescibacteria group bacterium]MBU1246970.1 DUF86 domain-containing protein [Patescibacteria group bacterium]MBU1519695.1 DUF86 domain-containing protein [Patescibacteria group bacterium]MBU1730285.1 DUF86 domain-containing protein [Patescibacteria group bacterium]MBU1956717.1 DUF86 domain-containing protein [Patescibacteria group bacterium]
MLNTKLIKQKIDLIQTDLERLIEFKQFTFDEMAQDYIKYAALKNFLMEIIGRSIDINEHIIAKLGKEHNLSPKDYRETFLQLSELKILPAEFAKTIANSAGFRNAIVHEYNNLNKNIVYKTVGEAIEQHNDYCNYILEFLEQRRTEIDPAPSLYYKEGAG